MMPWIHAGTNAWGWVAMTGGMVVFWGLLIALGVALVRSLNRPAAGPSPRRPSAELVLAERYARGEIDEEEYQRRLATLTDARHEQDLR